MDQIVSTHVRGGAAAMETSGPAAAAAPDQRPRRWPREGAVSAFWLTAVAPVAISVVSLVLSVYTIIEANREPEVWLSAPGKARLAVWEGLARITAQPRLVSAASNDRIAVISDLRLEVNAPEGGPPILFAWKEQGDWRYDPFGPVRLTYYYLADPAPLVVTPSSPQMPICAFDGPPGWRWQAGTYQVAIVAARGGNVEALRADFRLTLTEEDVNFLYANAEGGWSRFETEAVAPETS